MTCTSCVVKQIADLERVETEFCEDTVKMQTGLERVEMEFCEEMAKMEMEFKAVAALDKETKVHNSNIANNSEELTRRHNDGGVFQCISLAKQCQRNSHLRHERKRRLHVLLRPRCKESRQRNGVVLFKASHF